MKILSCPLCFHIAFVHSSSLPSIIPTMMELLSLSEYLKNIYKSMFIFLAFMPGDFNVHNV